LFVFVIFITTNPSLAEHDPGSDQLKRLYGGGFINISVLDSRYMEIEIIFTRVLRVCPQCLYG